MLDLQGFKLADMTKLKFLYILNFFLDVYTFDRLQETTEKKLSNLQSKRPLYKLSTKQKYIKNKSPLHLVVLSLAFLGINKIWINIHIDKEPCYEALTHSYLILQSA